MKLIPIFLLVGMLAVSGWAQRAKPEHYSPELVKKAEAGDAVAQWNLGMCYSGSCPLPQGFTDCKEVKKNSEEAIKWFTKSAEQGNPQAQFEMCQYYYTKANEYIQTTDNLPHIEEARKIGDEWCLKAANGGNQNAQLNLGGRNFYNSRSKGAARIEELEEAKKWYTKVAEKGDKQAEKMARSCEFEIQKIQRQLKTTKSK